MNDVFLKRIIILSMLLLLTIISKSTFAQIIFGLNSASSFNTTHHGPFSIYVGTFQIKHSADQLRERLAKRTHYPVRVRRTGQWYLVVIGPLSSPKTVRIVGSSLKADIINRRTLISHPNRQSNQRLTSSLPIIASQKISLLTPDDSLVSRLGITVLAGGSSYNFNSQGLVFFPAQTFRTDSFMADRDKINAAFAIGITDDKILESFKNKHWTILHNISLGVNAYFNENSQSGSVYEYSLPDFNNSTYNMNVKSYRVMLDTEWVLHPFYLGVMPFIEAGIGGARNTMSFNNIPRPNIGADGGNYSLSDSSMNFAYEIGLGLKMPVSNHFIISARYLFADAGNAKSGTSDNMTGVLIASPIRTRVQSQSVFLGLSYLFG